MYRTSHRISRVRQSRFCDDIEFSPEDAGRSDQSFWYVLEQAIKAGATTLNIPDTVGYTTPEEFGWLIKYLIDNTPGAETVIWSTHCHNDLGLATANTLAGVRQVRVRLKSRSMALANAGNTSLEEVVMAIETRPQKFDVKTNIDTTKSTQPAMVATYPAWLCKPTKRL